jgi:hypothetical protein
VLSPCHVVKSNHIAAFVLDLKSAYEGEHMTFDLLSLANLASLLIFFLDDLPVHDSRVLKSSREVIFSVLFYKILVSFTDFAN